MYEKPGWEQLMVHTLLTYRKRAEAPSLHCAPSCPDKKNLLLKGEERGICIKLSFGLCHIHKTQRKAAPAQRRSWLHILCQVTFCSSKLLARKDVNIFTAFLKVISAVSPAEPLNINWTCFPKIKNRTSNLLV